MISPSAAEVNFRPSSVEFGSPVSTFTGVWNPNSDVWLAMVTEFDCAEACEVPAPLVACTVNV